MQQPALRRSVNARRRDRRRSALALALGLFAAGAAAPAADVRTEWDFTALLDGKPIGSHRFVLAAPAGGSTTLRSDARFDVTLLGFPVYRYRHQATERWAGECLAAIDARTDDNGRVTEVRGQAQGPVFSLDVRNAEAAAATADALSGCVMSFAYWNPALAAQSRLLDPGSGRVEAVAVVPVAPASVDLDGRSAPVRGLRITGLARPIDVWYVGDRWVGLDTTVDGGRRLSYRLR